VSKANINTSRKGVEIGPRRHHPKIKGCAHCFFGVIWSSSNYAVFLGPFRHLQTRLHDHSCETLRLPLTRVLKANINTPIKQVKTGPRGRHPKTKGCTHCFFGVIWLSPSCAVFLGPFHHLQTQLRDRSRGTLRVPPARALKPT